MRAGGADEVLEGLVQKARAGERDALEEVVRRIQDRVYGLALRMLWHPQDAEDAAQEILVRIITHLGTFRGESAFETWVYRVAANYLLSTRRRRAEDPQMSFARFGEELGEGLAEPRPRPAAEEELLVEEVKIGCTQGMLLCLDRAHRLAYVLGEILAIPSAEAAQVVDISPAAFRQRLARARRQVRDFMRQHCGLVNPANPCRCARRIERAIELGRVDPRHLLFAGRPAQARRHTDIMKRVAEVEELQRAAAVFHTHPRYRAPAALVAGVKELLATGKYKVVAN